MYSEEQVGEILKSLENEEEYGDILRAKGMVSEKTEHGSTLTWFLENMKCVPERRNTRDVFV